MNHDFLSFEPEQCLVPPCEYRGTDWLDVQMQVGFDGSTTYYFTCPNCGEQSAVNVLPGCDMIGEDGVKDYG